MKNKLINFWYYHKIPLIIGIVILAAGIYFVLTQRETIKADYDIAVVSPHGLSGENREHMQSILEQAGTDQNGDGIVAVSIHQYRFAIGAKGQDREAVAGLDADLVGKVSGIFFVDNPEGFETATNGLGKAAEAIPVNELSRFSGCGIDELYMLTRTGADERYTLLKSTLNQP